MTALGTVTAKAVGTATITVTTLDQAKTAACKVTVVKTDVSGITVTSPAYTVLKGNTILISPNILPATATDKTYSIASSDSSIAKVVTGNKLQGMKAGSVTITFTTTDQAKVTTCTLNVIDSLDATVTIDKSLALDNNNSYISNIDSGSKISDLLKKITAKTGYKVQIVDKNDAALADTAVIATADKVVIKDMADSIIYTYTVIIYGDVNEDGKISASDYVLIKNNIMGTTLLNDNIQKAAADVNRDGKISASDYVLIKNHIMLGTKL